jgi:hypothetical protein
MSLKNIWSAIKKFLGKLIFISLLLITSLIYLVAPLSFIIPSSGFEGESVLYFVFFPGLPIALFFSPVLWWWTGRWEKAMNSVGWLFVSPFIIFIVAISTKGYGALPCLVFFIVKAVLLWLQIRKHKRDEKPMHELFFKPSHKDVVCTHAAKPSAIYFP